MRPGKELDTLIAEKVMGWRILSHWEPGVVKHLIDENQCEVHPPKFKPYSTSIEAAWEIVRKMESLSEATTFALSRDHEGLWECHVTGSGSKSYFGLKRNADTPEMAICLAALAAMAD